LSPKLVESGRHANIKIISNAQVASIAGEPGAFRVSVLKKPRYVDEDKCTACGTCTSYCPVEIPDQYNERQGKTKALYI
jgi:heterodisulfide reductase subunit A